MSIAARTASDARPNAVHNESPTILKTVPPLVSMMVEPLGFDGIYISGAVLANDLGIPDIGLTTLTEVCQRGSAIARATYWARQV